MKAIYCAGEQGRVALDIIKRNGETDVMFIDDDDTLRGETVDGVTVIGSLPSLDGLSGDVECIIAYGDSQGVRLDLANSVARAGYGFFRAIHPEATISSNVTLGEGVLINGETYLGPGAKIADHVLVDSLVNVSHDVIVEEGSIITPGATIVGGVEVGKDVYVGSGATVLEDLNIGDGAVIGGGAVVTENVDENETVVGVPAEPIGE